MLDHFSLEVVFVGGNAHLRARGEGEGIVGVSTSGSKLGPEILLDRSLWIAKKYKLHKNQPC